MPTTAGMTKFVTDCKCYPFHSALRELDKEFSAATKELKFKSKLGHAGANPESAHLRKHSQKYVFDTIFVQFHFR